MHTHDCHTLSKLRVTKAEWVDVEWEAQPSKLFETSVQVVTQSRRGVLAQLAAAIAQADTHIVNVSLDDDGSANVSLYFTMQVVDRIHLARVMRALRRIPEVVRIHRYVEK